MESRKVHVVIGLVMFALCSTLLARGPRVRPSEEPSEAGGNNLSFPVIWSDGVPLTLQGEYGTATFEGGFQTVDGVNWYYQQDPGNLWQAQSLLEENNSVNIDTVDWGDNLESKSWYTNSPIRVETVLYKTLDSPMTGYEMLLLSGQGISEMWGTNTNTYSSPEATIYTHYGQLIIQKLTADPEQAVVNWDGDLEQWTGAIEDPEFKSGVWQGSGYSAEINIQGKLIYGYNWRVASGPGTYRITFSISNQAGSKTFFTASTTVKEPVETESPAVMPAAEDGTAPTGGVPKIDSENNLSYIDVQIESRSQGGGKGNGGKGRQ